MENSNRLNLALQYARLGLKIHPLTWITDDGRCSCGSDHKGDTRKFGKHPLLGAWQDKASTDIETVKRWWTQWPQANVGLLTGQANGFIALDLDSYKAGYEAPQDVPDTVSVSTGSGGQQLYYRYPEGHRIGSRSNVTGKGKVDKGVDIKADGGYVVAVGSATHGGPYEWSSRICPTADKFHEILTPCPHWIIHLFNGQPKQGVPVNSIAGNLSDIDKARDALNRLSPGRADDYDSWLHVGMALHTVGVPLGDWIQWSRQSGKFDQDVCESKWKSFDTNHTRNFGLGSLIMWARQDSGVSTGEMVSTIDSDPFPDLIPLDSISLPEWPADVLPDPLGGYVLEVSHALHVQPGMSALCGLGSIALAAQGDYTVSPFPSWCEPINLYVLNVAPPGTRKSQTHAAMTEPLIEYERGIQAAAKPSVEQSLSKRRVLEKKRAIIEKRLSEGKSSYDELGHINDEIAEFQDIHTPCLMTGNATPEQLANLLSENDGRLGLFSAEPTPFSILAGLYTGGVPHLDVVLQAHMGDPIRIDRVGRPPVAVDKPCLTICLMCQQSVLEELRHKRLMVGSGLMARFLFCYSGYRQDEQDINASIDSETKRQSADMLLRLLHTRPNSPTNLTFSPEARDRFLQFKGKVDSMCRDDNSHGSGMQEWLSKLAGHVARIAALISLIDRKSGGYSTQIDIDIVERAIRIGDFLIPHAQKTLGCLGADPDLRIAERVVRRIKKARLTHFTKRDMFQALKGSSVSSVGFLAKPLQICVDHGIIRYVGGQNQRYEVNPLYQAGELGDAT
jgi:replicative DNA helicase